MRGPPVRQPRSRLRLTEGRRGGWPQICGLIRYRRGSVTIMDRRGLKVRSCGCYGVSRSEFDRLLGGRTMPAMRLGRMWGHLAGAVNGMSSRDAASGAIRLTRAKRILPGLASGTLALAVGMFVVAAMALAVNLNSAERQLWLGRTHERGASHCFRSRKTHPRSRVGRARLSADGRERYLDSYNRSQAEIPKTARGGATGGFRQSKSSPAPRRVAPGIEARLANSSRSSSSAPRA